MTRTLAEDDTVRLADLRGKVVLLDFFYKVAEERTGAKDSRGNWGNWYSAYLHLKLYCGKRQDITFRDVTPEWCEGWRRYLDKKAICQNRYNKKGELSDKIPISESSKQSYWAKFKAIPINTPYSSCLIKLTNFHTGALYS